MPTIQAIDRGTWIILAMAVIGVLVIFARTLDYGATAWDDPGYVFKNTALGPITADQVRTEFGRNVMGNYHPLTMLSYALDIRIADGKVPAIMHGSSVLLHLLNLLLVFLMVRAILGDPVRSVLVALLFAWHPMRVESVAWISGRKDLLMLCFAAMTMWCYASYLRRRSWPWLIAVGTTFLCACLSKATALAILPSLLLVDLVAGRSLMVPRVWLEKLPMLVIAVVIAYVTIPAQREGIGFGAVLDIPLAQRIILAAANIPVYLGQMTAPVGLSSFYGYAEGGHAVPDNYVLVAALLPVLTWLAYRYRGYRWVLLGCGFFVFNIALLLQWTSVGQAMRADRYTYLPSIGWSMVIVQVLTSFSDRGASVFRYAAPTMTYALVLASVSYARVPVWKDELTVWDDMIAHDPHSAMAHADRAGSNYHRGEYSSALRDAETALRIDPTLSLAHYNRGLVLMKSAKYDEALKELLPFAGASGAEMDLYEELVFGMMHTGRCEEALVFGDTILRRDPMRADALVKRSYCLAKLGRLEEARKEIDRSIAIKPDQADAWYTSAYVHLLAGDTISACNDCARSLQWPMKDGGTDRTRERFMAHFCKP